MPQRDFILRVADRKPGPRESPLPGFDLERADLLERLEIEDMHLRAFRRNCAAPSVGRLEHPIELSARRVERHRHLPPLRLGQFDAMTETAIPVVQRNVSEIAVL